MDSPSTDPGSLRCPLDTQEVGSGDWWGLAQVRDWDQKSNCESLHGFMESERSGATEGEPGEA